MVMAEMFAFGISVSISLSFGDGVLLAGEEA